jgi:hypothetical protein
VPGLAGEKATDRQKKKKKKENEKATDRQWEDARPC